MLGTKEKITGKLLTIPPTNKCTTMNVNRSALYRNVTMVIALEYLTINRLSSLHQRTAIEQCLFLEQTRFKVKIGRSSWVRV